MASHLKVTTVNMNARLKYASFTIAVVKWLARTFYSPNQRFSLARCTLEKYHRILITRGSREAIEFCKESRNSLYQWLATLDSLSVKSRLSSNCRLPKGLKSLKYLNDLDYPYLRLILSSLYISRGIELPVNPNISSIVSPSKGGSISDITKYTKDFWKALGVRHLGQNPRSVYWRKFHLSTKSGPNGHALWSSVADLSVLPKDLIDDIKVIGGSKLASRMDILSKYTNFLVPFFMVTGYRHRKISAIPAPEGKTREVAILDYWSQTSLRGLHQYLFTALKRIPQDCTFNQGSFQDKLNFDSKDPFYSVDLTAATDRFPISLIESVLRARFTDDYVNSWHNIMVGHPFFTKEFGEIRYSVGNPMGAYSSWNSFALSHHYVMYYCARELGMNWRDTKYCILGDDIVINDTILAKKYIDTLKLLGVEVSSKKTHVSTCFFEFAKRIFHCGVEVTPFPISALWTSRRQPSLMLNVLQGEEKKGWVSPIGTPAALSELYEILGFSRSYRSKLSKVLHITYQIMVAFQGRMDAAQALQPMLDKYYPAISNSPNIGVLTFARTINEAFKRSSDPGKGREPLGLIAENLVILITGDDNAAVDAFDLIAGLPILQIHGQIEETYLKIMRNPHSAFPLIMSGDWKQAMRALTIPISDRVYYARNQDLIVNASFSLAKIWMQECSKEVEAQERFVSPFGSILSTLGLA